MSRLAAAALALAVLGGCALGPRPADPIEGVMRFPVLSTEPGPLTGYQLEDARIVRDVEVVVATDVILWVPTRVRPPTLQEAVAQMLHRGRGDVVLNAEVERFGWYVPPFYGREGWRIRGDVARIRVPLSPRPTVLEPTTP
jgi:hypothetical protein